MIKVSNNIERENFVQCMEGITNILHKLQYDVASGIKTKTVKDLEEINDKMFWAVYRYDKEQLNRYKKGL